jgi:hypothetical protein
MAATYNITINQNADFRRSFQVKENNVIVNITNYTFSGRLKASFNDTSYVDFTTSITDAAAGTFSISLADTVTATMSPGTWVYDIIMTDTATEKTRLMSGNAFLKQGVTP